jgi:hypothetical protein
VAAQLNAANRDLYALILGVEGGEVLVNRTSFDRKGGKINVTTELAKDPNARLGGHGRESRQDESFEPGAKSAFELNPNTFATASRAQAVLFHEVSHLKDYELTQRWVAAYEKAGATFVGGPGVQYFERWVKSATSAADAQLVSDIASGAQATTEARAYVRTAIAAFDVGAGVEAAAQLSPTPRGWPAGRSRSPRRRTRTRCCRSSRPSGRRTASVSAVPTGRPSTRPSRPPSRRTRSPGSPGSNAAEDRR